MSASKRERAQARKRYEKQQARQARKAERRSRNVALGVSLTLLVALVLIAIQLRPHPTPPPEDAYANNEEVTSGAEPDQDVDTPEEGDAPEDVDVPEAPEPGGPRHTGLDGQPLAAPDPAWAEDREWTGTITINGQPVEIALDGVAAPTAVANFVNLAKNAYFDGTTCHRLVTAGIYVLQCGDPEGTGMGGPGYDWGPIENAPAEDSYGPGVIAMARRGGDGQSMGSQFFIVYGDSPIPSDGAGGYTIFGHVTTGLEVVTEIAKAGTESGETDGAPATTAVIDKVEVQ
ncbi:MAG: peptidylprolyl isomerase [Micrococcales bacterium]|nr:peptidylprolyl isomerase [Micrococcales bacterium]